MLKEDHKGTILTGGAETVDVKEKYFPPTVVVNPSQDSKLMKEEIFGPILPVLEIKSIDEAINFINLR